MQENPLPNDDSLVGAVLSRRFRLTRKLGTGGMGSVYATDATQDGRAVAVKILHSEFVKEPGVCERFLEEARSCQRLIHPNILRVFECLQAEDGSPYITMELLEGVPLSAYTTNGGRVPLAQGVTILQGILAGLAVAHGHGIVHRDLKPDNVFLAREPSGHFTIKLLDFGIAKVMDAAGGMGQKTRTGMLLGTPAYMSPEQIKNAKDVDARADLWSAGVMFYEMLTGRVAFPAPTEYARLFAVLNHTPELLERIDPQLLVVAPLVLHAMQKDRDARFGSALEMARALALAVGAGEAPSQRGGMPLSRLPEVASLFAQSVSAAASPIAESTPSPRLRATPAPETTKGPGGTLASPRVGIVSDSTPPPQQVVVMQSHGGTLPSKDLPMLDAVSSGAPRIGRGISPTLLILLVAIALLAGLSIGFALGRAM